MSRIGVYLPESPWGEVTLETAKLIGMGGRETALVSLIDEWARNDHQVWAFVPMESDTSRVVYYRNENNKDYYGDTGKITYVPNQFTVEVAEALDLDLFISWENAEVFRAIDGDVGTRVIEMQVAHLETMLPLHEYKLDYVAVLSEWAKRFIIRQHPDWKQDRIIVLRNGVDLSRFDLRRRKRKDIIQFIYSSSPDRGLHHLLLMWPQIRDKIKNEYEKEAILHVCYGIESFVSNSRWSHREDAERALTIEENINNEGVWYHGKVGQDELAQLMVDSDLMLYPCDTMSPTETGCISIVEALAARTPVVTTTCDCIGEDYGNVTMCHNLPLTYDNYIDSVMTLVNSLHDTDDRYPLRNIGYPFVLTRSWENIAREWEEAFLK